MIKYVVLLDKQRDNGTTPAVTVRCLPGDYRRTLLRCGGAGTSPFPPVSRRDFSSIREGGRVFSCSGGT